MFENQRVSQIQSSASMVVSLRAKALVAEGREIIDLSLGEPDFDTPAHILDAANACMRRATLRYTGPSGIAALKSAIIVKFERENGLTYRTDEITVANGAKQILHNALMATLEPGDEVIVPAPYWVSYTDLVTLHGGVGVVLPCSREERFKLTAAALEAAITPKTRWLMLNSPCNPTGAVYSLEEQQALGEVLAKYPQVLVMSDEIYEHVVLGEEPCISFVTANPTLKDRTLIVNGVSKAYAMTGWRVGYAAGPAPLIAAISKLQSQSTSGVNQMAQEAATAALLGPQEFIGNATKQYRARAELFINGLAKIEGLEIDMPHGAFYAYPDCSGVMGKRTPDGTVIENDRMLATYLLEEGGVSSVPGAAFGLSPYLRFSIAASQTELEAALVKIEKAIGALS